MSSELTAGLMIVHGNRAELLRELLADWIRRYPLAPLEPELVLVQSNGVAQWLKLALAADPADGGCGIAAALQFSLPSRFQWQVYRALLGEEAVPESSPFDKERLTWRLMRLLPSISGEPRFEPLRRYLAEDGDLRKRFQLAERLADLFDQYQVYRADWLHAWAEGEDCLIDARGQRRPLAAGQCWQPALWRVLLTDMARPAGGRAGVHRDFLAAAGAWRGAPPRGLPRRVLVFGISSLPRQTLEVLATLARWSQVVLCVPNPCEHYWADIVSGVDLLRASHSRQRRRAGAPAQLTEEQLHLHAQPLLAAWGKQGRDFIALLDEYDSAGERGRYAALFRGQRIDLFESHGEATLLQQLQEDIRQLRPLGESRALWPPIDASADESIRFHIAHTPQREVEILHDRLLDAFNADPTLRPRDVIVMVPDIDAYAPHIQAVFGLLETGDPRHIPYTLVDQSQRRSDPLVNAVELLLALPQGRLGVGELLDLLEAPALRRRFGIGEEQLPLLQRWVRGANVRWGLHAEQRAALGLSAAGEINTWLFGLQRMLLGYAVGEGEAWQGIEPYHEVGGLEAALAGPLAQLLVRLDASWRQLRQPATAGGWCERLRRLLDDFFDPGGSGDEAEAWTLQQLLQGLEQWREECEEAQLQEALPLSVVGEQWLARLDQGGLNQRFFAGAVTFATLMPMRAIPFRQVCLLGMNDGDYPRPRMPLDFDLMAADYRPGDRSRRDDDRYLFLEALLSARERLHISWVGRSVADNTPRPPSVLVGQLRDHLAAGWQLADGGELLDALTIEHPLQPFSPAAFGPAPRFSYAREWLAAPGATPDSAALPPPEREEPLSVAELADFLRDPVKAFFRQRLQVAFEREAMTGEESEPFDLDGLERWRLQQELIAAQARALQAGEEPAPACQRALQRMQGRGDLPAGAFGELLAEELAEPMPELFEAYAEALARWPQAIEGEEEIQLQAANDGRPLELADWVGGLRQGPEGRGHIVLESSAVTDGGGHYRGEVLARYWVRHLAGNLTGPLTTLVLSKRGSVELLPLVAEEAEARLSDLLLGWHQGMQGPLPLPIRTAFAWLRETPEGAEGAAAMPISEEARRTYEGGWQQEGELARSPYLQRCWPDFESLLAAGGFTYWAEKLLRPLQRAMHEKADQRREERA